MSHNPIELQEGAFVISDAHYSHQRGELLDFVKKIHSKDIFTTQLILMGDIFDALFGGIDFTYKQNQELIHLINEISLEMEVIYLEGNHDFNLSKIFPHSKVVSVKKQPVLAHCHSQRVYLSHGDFDGTFLYKLYTAFIRNPFILFILKYLDSTFNHFILKNLDAHLAKKDDCNKFEGFREFIRKRMSGRFECDYFIEGHFHQNSSFRVDGYKYINLAAFACNQRYFIIKYSKGNINLLQKRFSKEKYNG